MALSAGVLQRLDSGRRVGHTGGMVLLITGGSDEVGSTQSGDFLVLGAALLSRSARMTANFAFHH